MKEESVSKTSGHSVSVNYDVPIIFRKNACFGNDLDSNDKTRNYKLKWIGASVPNKELMCATNPAPIVFLKPSSRPSACLINFMMTNRIVLVEDADGAKYMLLFYKKTPYILKADESLLPQNLKMIKPSFDNALIAKNKSDANRKLISQIHNFPSLLSPNENESNMDLFKQICEKLIDLCVIGFDSQFIENFLEFFDCYLKSFIPANGDQSNKMMEVLLNLKRNLSSNLGDHLIFDTQAAFNAHKDSLIEFIMNLGDFNPANKKYKSMFAQFSNTVTNNFKTHFDQVNPQNQDNQNPSKSAKIDEQTEDGQGANEGDGVLRKSSENMYELWKKQASKIYDQNLRPLAGQLNGFKLYRHLQQS